MRIDKWVCPAIIKCIRTRNWAYQVLKEMVMRPKVSRQVVTWSLRRQAGHAAGCGSLRMNLRGDCIGRRGRVPLVSGYSAAARVRSVPSALNPPVIEPGQALDLDVIHTARDRRVPRAYV